MNGSKKDIIARIDPVFKKELEEIKLQKIKNGTAKKLISDRRLTKAMRRMSYWSNVKQTLIESEIKEDLYETH